MICVEQHPDVTQETAPDGVITHKYKGVPVCIDHPLTIKTEPVDGGEKWTVTWVFVRLNFNKKDIA